MPIGLPTLPRHAGSSGEALCGGALVSVMKTEQAMRGSDEGEGIEYEVVGVSGASTLDVSHKIAPAESVEDAKTQEKGGQ